MSRLVNKNILLDKNYRMLLVLTDVVASMNWARGLNFDACTRVYYMRYNRVGRREIESDNLF